MSIRARELTSQTIRTPSYFRVRAGESRHATFELSDGATGALVDWSGHNPRFRIYSQIVDRAVVVEITDPHRCSFSPDGIWRLQLTAEETAMLPRGGMHFTLEHRDSDGQFYLGVHGGVSCYVEDATVPQTLQNIAHFE